MFISFRLLVLVIATLLIALAIFLKISSISIDEELKTDYPQGSFEVYMFFERHQNHQ